MCSRTRHGQPVPLAAVAPLRYELEQPVVAFAMMGGIIVDTVLTLLFLPALYVALFRIKEPKGASGVEVSNPSEAPLLNASA